MKMKTNGFIGIAVTIMANVVLGGGKTTYTVVDTGQRQCYDESREIACPSADSHFSGQDGQYAGIQPAYRDNGDGTVSDLHTGLMWQKNPGRKMTYDQAVVGNRTFRLAGYSDWRLPTIKELYSLIRFDGLDPMPTLRDERGLKPFIDNSVFKFHYGKEEDGDRIIDSQYASATLYTGPSMGPDGRKVFGVNFADGRIKGYGTRMPGRGEKRFYVMFVRGNPEYGKNRFVDNGDGTVTDQATGLMWQQADSGKGMNWADALGYAGTLHVAGHADWRLPNAKELQSIVDYTRSPDATGSAAIDPVFRASTIRNEAGQVDYPSYWTSTTHVSMNGLGDRAVYLTFGRAMGYMHGHWRDVHGAGSQRSDPKAGNPADYPQGRGPQGDAIRILNYVRCVRLNTLPRR